MAGQQFPLVLHQRYSTWVGAGGYSTVALDVAPFSGAVITLWRGTILPTGGGGGFGVTFEESADRVDWAPIPGSTNPADPGEKQEATYELTFTKRYFRATVTLLGQDDVVMSWATGFLQKRK